MSKYLVWPVFTQDDGSRTVPEAVLAGIWDRLCETGAAENAFWGGSVQNAQQFIGFMYGVNTAACLVVDTEVQKVVFLAWLSDINGGSALAHFCGVERFERSIARAVIDHWSKFGLEVLTGITPENNERALRMIRLIGFKRAGVVPKTCELFYENIRVGGVISYYEF